MRYGMLYMAGQFGGSPRGWRWLWGFLGSGGASQALDLALWEALAATMKVGGQVGENGGCVRIGAIGDDH